MKSYKNLQFLLAFVAILGFSACDSDDPEPVQITATGFAKTIAENPAQGFVLGTPTATADRGTIIFAIASQTPAGAMAIDATSGELTVANASLFDFETNPILKATISASAEGVSQSAEIVINLTDVAETVMASPFAVTIDENPTANQSLGTVSATSDAGASLTYSIVAGVGNATAFAINSTTGELTVADASQFDFETNPTLTANYEASNGAGSQQSTITVTLNDVDEGAGSVPFISTWETTNANPFISVVPVPAPTGETYTIDYTVDWGDGTIDSDQTTRADHQYANAGTYIVKITGELPGFQGTGIARHMREVNQWGNIEWKSFNGFFRLADDLVFKATDSPDLSDVTDMNNAFSFAENVSGDMSGWDLSNIDSMRGIFFGTQNFTADMSGWNLANLTSLENAFRASKDFDGKLSDWNFGSLETLKFAFYNAEDFNSDISDWDVSTVTDMSLVFAYERSSTEKTMNPDLSKWEVGNVTNMSGMFLGLANFDSDISNWDVSKVVNMNSMFSGATSFDQDISGWNVSKVETMERLLEDATSFNQSLESWNLVGLTGNTGLNKAFSNTAISVANYDAMLNGWANNVNTPNSLVFNQEKPCFSNPPVSICASPTFPTLTYSTVGEVGRNKLINNKNWTISGDSKQ